MEKPWNPNAKESTNGGFLWFSTPNLMLVYRRVAGKLFLKVGPRGTSTRKQSTQCGDVWLFSVYAELRTFLWGTSVPNWWDHRLGWIIRTPQHRHMISQRTLLRKIIQEQPRFKMWFAESAYLSLKMPEKQGTSISSGVISFFPVKMHRVDTPKW